MWGHSSFILLANTRGIVTTRLNVDNYLQSGREHLLNAIIDVMVESKVDHSLTVTELKILESSMSVCQNGR